MLSTSVYSAKPKPSIMAFNKSTVVVWVAISLIVVETFSGALRYYFDKAGLSGLMYLPKAACVAMFVLELHSMKSSRGLWLALLLLVISAVLGMLHGATPNNVAFTLFNFGPLLFGLACSDHLLHRRRLFCWAVSLCLLASLVGVVADKFTTLPWKGYSYFVNGQELAANTTWAADEVDRLAGFARVSNVLSIIIAIHTLYLVMFVRSKLLIFLIGMISLYGIVLTTSKAPAMAFMFTLLLLMALNMHWTSRFLMIINVVIGLGLPIMSLLYDFDPNAVSSPSAFSSFYDRLVNTWPNSFSAVNDAGWSLTGTGFGMFGSSVALFPVVGAEGMIGSDSSAVYLWALFGLGGILLYVLQIPMLFKLIRSPDPLSRALLAITFCIIMISWTTDMFEVATANLFMGLAIGRALSSKLLATPAQPHARELQDTDSAHLPDLT
jgi:hypothetical protein